MVVSLYSKYNTRRRSIYKYDIKPTLIKLKFANLKVEYLRVVIFVFVK